MRRGTIHVSGESYGLSLQGLVDSGLPEAYEDFRRSVTILETLRKMYLESPTRKDYDVSEVAGAIGRPVEEIQVAFEALVSTPGSPFTGSSSGPDTRLRSVSIDESMLDYDVAEIYKIDTAKVWTLAEDFDATYHLQGIRIEGYRSFRDLELGPGPLTVLIGANATGKSNLIRAFQFVQRLTTEPLPPEIEEGSGVSEVFHLGGPDRIALSLDLELGFGVPLRYEVEVIGPVGNPQIPRERLVAIGLPEGQRLVPADPDREPWTFIDRGATDARIQDPTASDSSAGSTTTAPLTRYRGGVTRNATGGGVLAQVVRADRNESILRRSFDPSLRTIRRLQDAIGQWRFYSGFTLGSAVGLASPAMTEPDPVLTPDGSNLSAVLLSLRDDHECWTDLERNLRLAVPGFSSMRVSPYGGPGRVLATIREEGHSRELPIGDLSDGTLRFLCWAVVCLTPRPATLLCIDEPELGLHPRVLPLVASLIRLAGEHSQVIVSTHSPYLLSQFRLDEIGVMRREDGQPRFVRPDTSASLRGMLEELGDRALIDLHISDELETLP